MAVTRIAVTQLVHHSDGEIWVDAVEEVGAHIACVLVDIAGNTVRLILRAAPTSQRARIAIALAGAVALPPVGAHGSTRSELLAIRTDADAASAVPAEIRTREFSFLALGTRPGVSAIILLSMISARERAGGRRAAR